MKTEVYVHRNHPYLKAHRRWKYFKTYWEKNCKPHLPRGCSDESVGYSISVYQNYLDLIRLLPLVDPGKNNKRVSLDWYDESFDGYYDIVRYKYDHMETI
jgi:hypothetical protein